jgi:hypothetical protein
LRTIALARIGAPPSETLMRSLIVLVLWLAIGFGLTALVASELERSRTAHNQAAVQSDEPDSRHVRASDVTTP